MVDDYFTPLDSSLINDLIPKKLNNPFEVIPLEVCNIATKKLQQYITETEHTWAHNFGTDKNKTGPIKGKMFGVLIVENTNKELGFLSAFSGKLDQDDFNNIFVPSLFDTSVEDYFLDKGMGELTLLCNQIDQLKEENNNPTELQRLKLLRKNKSFALQQKIFDQYIFLNKSGDLKDIRSIFKNFSGKKPAAGAGECAAPKLFQYAFKNQLKPLAIAEFWWGKTVYKNKKHLVFYPACEDKCRPILNYMLNL